MTARRRCLDQWRPRSRFKTLTGKCVLTRGRGFHRFFDGRAATQIDAVLLVDSPTAMDRFEGVSYGYRNRTIWTTGVVRRRRRTVEGLLRRRARLHVWLRGLDVGRTVLGRRDVLVGHRAFGRGHARGRDIGDADGSASDRTVQHLRRERG